MKKYYQLLLIIISLISLMLVIIYRNEYNRLHYVLEVLNFFGKPNDFANSNCLLLENITTTNKYNIPTPAWQNVNDAVYIYSAFWNKSRYGGTVQAIGFATNLALPMLMCSVSFMENENPVKGKFSVIPIDKIKKEYSNKAYIFLCQINKDFGEPFNVMYYKDSNKKTPGTPIFSTNYLTNENRILACVKPDFNIRNPTKMIEFLNFHQIVGIKNYIIYDNGFLIPSLWNPLIGLDITILPWNLPFHLERELIHSIIEVDCSMRVKNTADVLAVLNWNELIVPNTESTIFSLLQVHDPFEKARSYQFTILDFCTDFINEEITPKTQVIFHKLHFKRSKEVAAFLTRPRLINDINLSEQLLDSNVAIVQRYIECFKQSSSNKLDRSSIILKYNTDFVKTNLYQLWISGSLLK